MSYLINNTIEAFEIFTEGNTSLEEIQFALDEGEIVIDTDLFNSLLETYLYENEMLEEGVVKNMGRMFTSSITRLDNSLDKEAFDDRSLDKDEGRYSARLERKAYNSDKVRLKKLSNKHSGIEGIHSRASLHDAMADRSQKIADWHRHKEEKHKEKAEKAGAFGKMYHTLRKSKFKKLADKYQHEANGQRNTARLLKGAQMSSGHVSDQF